MNTWSVRPEGNQSVLVSEALVELKNGAHVRVFEPLFSAVFARMAPNSLAASK
jgi:hypothetical protein